MVQQTGTCFSNSGGALNYLSKPLNSAKLSIPLDSIGIFCLSHNRLIFMSPKIYVSRSLNLGIFNRAVETLFKNPVCLGGLYRIPIKIGLVFGSRRSKKMCSILQNGRSILLKDVTSDVAYHSSPPCRFLSDLSIGREVGIRCGFYFNSVLQ